MMHTRRAAAALLVVGVGVVGSAASASAAPSRRAAQRSCADQTVTESDGRVYDSPQDLDDDGHSDLVIGIGRLGAGAIDIRYAEGTPAVRTQRISQSYFAGMPQPQTGDGFGSSMTIADVNGDNCQDLVIGVPGAAQGRGAVIIALGTVDGLGAAGAVRVVGQTAGEHFGAALAAAGDDIWVGAPQRSVGGRTGAGAIDHLRMSGSTAQRVETLTEGLSLVPGIPETGDHFGSVLAASATTRMTSGTVVTKPLGVIVGEPDEDAGRAVDAGTVTFITTSTSTHRAVSAHTVSQDSPGVGGTSETGDRFGAAVASNLDLAVGVPGEDIGNLTDAGLVQIFALGADGTLTVKESISQDTPGVPGVVEAGDQWGASVLAGYLDANLDCLGPDGRPQDTFAIGAPGEDNGSVRDAGTVTEVSRCPAPHHALVISQRTGSAGGVAETGDRFGSGLSALAYSYVFTIDQYFSGGQALVISVPGEDVGPRADVGDIVVFSFRPAANYRDSTGDHAGERYGTGAGTVSNGVSSYAV